MSENFFPFSEHILVLRAGYFRDKNSVLLSELSVKLHQPSCYTSSWGFKLSCHVSDCSAVQSPHRGKLWFSRPVSKCCAVQMLLRESPWTCAILWKLNKNKSLFFVVYLFTLVVSRRSCENLNTWHRVSSLASIVSRIQDTIYAGSRDWRASLRHLGFRRDQYIVSSANVVAHILMSSVTSRRLLRSRPMFGIESRFRRLSTRALIYVQAI